MLTFFCISTACSSIWLLILLLLLVLSRSSCFFFIGPLVLVTLSARDRYQFHQIFPHHRSFRLKHAGQNILIAVYCISSDLYWCNVLKIQIANWHQMLICRCLSIFLLPVLSLFSKLKFNMDKCDESVTSQTTISINVAFDRIWMLAASMKRSTERKDFAFILRSHCHTESRPMVCPFRYTNHWQIPTFASRMQATSPPWARAASTLRPAHGVLTFSHAAIKAFFVTSLFWCTTLFLLKLMSSNVFISTDQHIIN